MSLMRTCSFLGLFGLAVFAASDASAQQIYRIVGPDGRVTFSDKPPLDSGVRTSAVAVPQGGAAAMGALPFELRQVATRYPVVLYSGPGCAPCGAGRAMLVSRGIPFTEKTVSSNEDITALARLTGSQTLPALSIGEQQLKGYSEIEWTKFLDAAGYPATSVLPAGYSPPPAAPLVTVQQAQAPARPRPSAESQAVASPPPLAEPAPAAQNPAGIQF